VIKYGKIKHKGSLQAKGKGIFYVWASEDITPGLRDLKWGSLITAVVMLHPVTQPQWAKAVADLCIVGKYCQTSVIVI
jgi:hypothetical protein